MKIQLFFREAVLEDLPGIVRIYNSTVSSRMVTADTKEVLVEDRLAWFEKHKPGYRPLLVAETTTNQLVAWVSFEEFYGRSAYAATAEISIYVDEKYRGQGIGRQVLSRALGLASQLGIKTLLGFIFLHNEPSLRLFKSFGFQSWAHLPGVAILDGQERSLEILGKRIQD